MNNDDIIKKDVVSYNVTNINKQLINLNNIPEEDLDSVLEELEKLNKVTLFDYIPHEKQKLFHSAVEKIRFLSGGNRSGKTEAGCLEAIFHSTGIYPDWYPKEKRLLSHNKGRIVVTDYGKACGKVIEPKLFQWLPKELIVATKRTVKGHLEELQVRHVDGGVSVFDVMTHEQDVEQFEGWSGHWAWFDEPPPRDMFIATQRGLIDFKGRCWLTLTPVNEPWLHDEYIMNESNKVFFMVVDIRDNTRLRDLLGAESFEEEIKAFEATLREDEKEARLHGKFIHLSGRIYKEFDPVIHCISEKNFKIDDRWPTYFAMDPHDRKPHHGIWIKIDPLGNLYVIKELKFKGTIKEVCKQILLRERLDRIDSMSVIRIGDPNKMETPSAVNGLKFKDEFASHAVHFITNVNDDIALGHLAVAEKLWYDKTKPLSSTNKPKLFFVRERCPEVVQAIQMYIWDNWRGKNKDIRGEKEKPQETYKDFMDCLRYLVMSRPTFFFGQESDPVPFAGETVTGYHG